jgi:hypothetical protein
MSEKIELIFSEPQLLIDPHKKNIDPEEDVFLITIIGKVPQTNICLGLAALSHSLEGVKEYVSPFVARREADSKNEDSEQTATVVVIERKVDDPENDQPLLNTDLFLDITALDLLNEGNSVVVKLNIDPLIDADHSHVFTFSSRSSTSDYIKVEAQIPTVSCELYDSNQPSFAQLRSIRQEVRSGQARIFVTNPTDASGGIRVGAHLEKSQLDNMIKNLATPLWDKVVTNRPQRTELKSDFRTNNYALIVKGPGQGKGQSEYTIKGRITMD